jgi:hypothetical protein
MQSEAFSAIIYSADNWDLSLFNFGLGIGAEWDKSFAKENHLSREESFVSHDSALEPSLEYSAFSLKTLEEC